MERETSQNNWLGYNGNRIPSPEAGFPAQESKFREAASVNPKNDSAHFGIGYVLEHQGDSKGALEEYHTAATLNPGNAPYQQNYDRLLSQVNK